MKNQAHRPIVVKGPYPTANEVAALLGLSRRETKQMDEIIEAYRQEEQARQITRAKKRSQRRNDAKVRRRAK